MPTPEDAVTKISKEAMTRLQILEIAKLRGAELHPPMPNRPPNLQVADIQRVEGYITAIATSSLIVVLDDIFRRLLEYA